MKQSPFSNAKSATAYTPIKLNKQRNSFESPQLGTNKPSQADVDDLSSWPSIDSDECDEKVTFVLEKKEIAKNPYVMMEPVIEVMEAETSPRQKEFSFQPRNPEKPIAKYSNGWERVVKANSRKDLYEKLYQQYKPRPTTEECQMQRELRELELCSFQPKIISDSKFLSPKRCISPKDFPPGAFGQDQRAHKVIEQLYDFDKQKHQKIEQLKHKQMEIEMAPCTFSPKINKTHQTTGHRTKSPVVPVAPSNETQPKPSSKYFKNMIDREIQEMLSHIGVTPLHSNTLAEVLTLFGYVTVETTPLIVDVFHMMTGMVKECHRGYSQQTKILKMKATDLRVLLYVIHNIPCPKAFKDYLVYPEALSTTQCLNKERYTFAWKLDNEKDLKKFNNVLKPFKLHHMTSNVHWKQRVAKPNDTLSPETVSMLKDVRLSSQCLNQDIQSVVATTGLKIISQMRQPMSYVNKILFEEMKNVRSVQEMTIDDGADLTEENESVEVLNTRVGRPSVAFMTTMKQLATEAAIGTLTDELSIIKHSQNNSRESSQSRLQSQSGDQKNSPQQPGFVQEVSNIVVQEESQSAASFQQLNEQQESSESSDEEDDESTGETKDIGSLKPVVIPQAQDKRPSVMNMRLGLSAAINAQMVPKTTLQVQEVKHGRVPSVSVSQIADSNETMQTQKQYLRVSGMNQYSAHQTSMTVIGNTSLVGHIQEEIN